jgi:hypothetical protein
MGLSLERLKRLQRIRGLQEQMARGELERANLALRAAEVAVGEQLLQRTAARRASRKALLEGDREEWHLGEAAREVSQWNLEKMEVERTKQAAAVEPARVVFMEARREEEQMKILRKKAELAKYADLKRAEQEAADEWYRSRTGTDDGKYS